MNSEMLLYGRQANPPDIVWRILNAEKAES